MLKRFTARTIRILFLQQSWHAKMNFSEQGLHEASVKENSLKEFFLNLKTAMRTQPPISQVDQKWNASDRDLHKQVIGTQDVVHRSLLNNLDYPKAMEVIFGMSLVP
jgi:cysteinyl-tRNA synthetase